MKFHSTFIGVLGLFTTSLASAAIIEVAGPRIVKANTTLRKRGAGISADAPAPLLHRLRIDGKRLRYLLEFFFDLYPSVTMTRFIKELKRLQDLLGNFNDTEVQLALIRDFRDEHPSAAYDTPVKLIELLTERQHELRAEFSERFTDFTSEESRNLYNKTFKNR